jgi:hypothetical protein
MNNNPLAALAIMSPPKPNEPAEIMREVNATAKFEAFERKLNERGGYLTWADTEASIKEFGCSRVTAYGVTYEYGTHPLAALAMRERAAKACKDQHDIFLNDTHRRDQPIDSIEERFACDECATAIRALPTTFTDDQLLAAAWQLPEVRALVENAKRLVSWAEQTRASGDAGFWNWRDGDEYSDTLASLAPFKGDNK